MGSISDVLNIATSGLQTAQSLVKVTSDNIANVNTPGYARKIGTQSEIVAGGDATGSQNTQAQLLDQLAGLMQIQVQPTATGGVTVRSSDGSYLVGDQGASTLSYSTLGSSGVMTATRPKGSPQQIRVGGGAIAGLMQMGQIELPQLANQLSEFVSGAVDQINAAHNNASAVPPPASLTGSNVGMSLNDAALGFTSGKTTIAITNAAGVLQKTVAINFGGTAGTMTVDGGAVSAYTPGGFLASLNLALGTSGTASFTNGVLQITASSGNGVAISDDPANPSQNVSGESFGQFFGLNDLIKSNTTSNYNTGINGSSPNTFATGGTIKLELADASGAAIRQATLTIPSTAATMNDVIAGLNQSIGAYGSFGLDTKGQLIFSPAPNSGVSISVVSDSTVNSVGGGTFTQMFGIGASTRGNRAASFSIRADIAANPSKMALAQLDLTQTVGGSPALGAGDGRGALAMATSGQKLNAFSPAGDMSPLKLSVSDYAAELSGLIGTKAANADTARQSAVAVSAQADAQRSSVEGVNMDEELVNLTVYQQSYSACSRLIQASSDMFQVLLQMI